MKRRFFLLTKLFVLVSLVLAMLPAGATETVCVVGAQKEVAAVRECGMPCCAHKRKIEPPKAACCMPKAEPREACPASLNCQCETRYVATNAPSVVATDKFSFAELHLAIVDAPLSLIRIRGSAPALRGTTLDVGVAPPRKVPRAPMRGRAPPVTNL